jgi:hypothetical protein
VAAGALIWRGSEWNLREGGGYCSRSETVTSVVTGWRWKMELTGGSHLSARGSEEGWVTVRDRKDGPQAPFLCWAERFPSGPFHIFISFFLPFLFCFLYFFISFSSLIPIESYQLQRFYKT